MIPKKIHYCWFGPKPFPRIVEKCIDTWKTHLQEYEFFLWNESNSPMNVPFVKEAHEAEKYAFVSDYVRFWALLNHGGIYLDTDMYVTKTFDKLLDNQCFFAYETSEENILSCGVIGSEKEGKFVKHVMDEYNNIHFSNNEINRLVIPRIITPIYEKLENKEEVQIFPYDYFYPFPYNSRDDVANFMDYVTDNTLAIHLWNLSWVSDFQKLLSKIVRRIKKKY